MKTTLPTDARMLTIDQVRTLIGICNGMDENLNTGYEGKELDLQGILDMQNAAEIADYSDVETWLSADNKAAREALRVAERSSAARRAPVRPEGDPARDRLRQACERLAK